jgi:hypothetical protein
MRNKRPYVLAAIFWSLHFLALLTLGTCVVLFVQYQNRIALEVMLGALVLAIITWVVAYFRRKSALCPMCKGTPLLPSGAIPHMKATKLPLLNHGVSAVINIIFSQHFTCMYCGSRYDLLKHYRGHRHAANELDL